MPFSLENQLVYTNVKCHTTISCEATSLHPKIHDKARWRNFCRCHTTGLTLGSPKTSMAYFLDKATQPRVLLPKNFAGERLFIAKYPLLRNHLAAPESPSRFLTPASSAIWVVRQSGPSNISSPELAAEDWIRICPAKIRS